MVNVQKLAFRAVQRWQPATSSLTLVKAIVEMRLPHEAIVKTD